jgi:hypothetical protein
MTQEEKAQIYGSLLNEHTKCFNEINRIKAESLELNPEQKQRIFKLERRQNEIMQEVNKLLS